MESSEGSPGKPDDTQYEEFCTQNRRRLRSFIRRQIAAYEMPIRGSEQADLVESVVQDAFLSMYIKWEYYDSGRASRYTWLTHMARGRLKTKLRAWRRHADRRGEAIDELGQAICDVDNWLTDIVFQEYCDGLGPEQARIVKLKEDGFTNEEIGERVGKSPASVKGITQRLRQKARDLPSPI